jgi:hypothetical protein
LAECPAGVETGDDRQQNNIYNEKLGGVHMEQIITDTG